MPHARSSHVQTPGEAPARTDDAQTCRADLRGPLPACPGGVTRTRRPEAARRAALRDEKEGGVPGTPYRIARQSNGTALSAQARLAHLHRFQGLSFAHVRNGRRPCAKNPTHYIKAASRACRSEQIVGAQELIQVYLGATSWLLNFFSRASRAGRALFSRLEWRQPQQEYRLLDPVAEQDHRNPTGHGSAQANQTQTPFVHIRPEALRLAGGR